MRTTIRGGWVCVLGLIANSAAAAEPPPLFPFVISYDAPDNASSMAHLLDAPAGKHGFIRVENGRFVNDAGPVRLHATNLTGPANFPTHEQADKLAARLARFGINCVRLHYFDAAYGNFMTEKETGIFGEDAELAGAISIRTRSTAGLPDRGPREARHLRGHNLHVARSWTSATDLRRTSSCTSRDSTRDSTTSSRA